MSDILFIKTSSLGDVIHHMPALTEARRRLPDARFAWVVEEAFAPLVRLHPAVSEVIPVALRRWRQAALAPATWGEAVRFTRALRARRYDAIVDTQGLALKSAAIARLARGPRHGYDQDSIRERAATWLYDVRHGGRALARRANRGVVAGRPGERKRARAAAARPERAVDRGGCVRHRCRHRAAPPRGGARRSAGGDLRGQRAWSHRAVGGGADRR